MWWLLGLALAAPLTLDEVLDAVDDRVPELAAAVAKEEQARAKLLASRGAFDPKLKAKASQYLDGYDRQLLDAGVAGQTLFGPAVAGGWRNGSGDFPTYDGRKTGSGGEAYLAVDVPLLDGLVWSEARTERQVSALRLDATAASRDDKARLVRWKAAQSWAKWAANGAKLRIQEDLVAQTERRQLALDREAEEGTRSRLSALDNQRALAERRASLAEARQDVFAAAQGLSLFWRDATGAPRVPSLDELPPLAVAASEVPPDSARELAEARADLRQLEAVVDAAGVSVRRQRNALLPEVAIGAEAVRPLDGELPPELIAGVSVELASLLRKERGSVQAAVAAQAQLDAARRAQRDAAVAEIETARNAVVLARERLAHATEGATVADEVLRLEQRRFELGGSDMFVLLGRETKRVEAQKKLVDAQLAVVLSEVGLAASEGR